MSSLPIGRLHVITDEVIQDRFDHVALARLAIDGGAEVIQYREKRAIADRARFVVAEALARLCADRGVTLLIDDRADIAALVGAGLHVGANDLPVAAARRLLSGPIGATANRLDMALDPDAALADYLGVGPVFGTTSKGPRPPPTVGIDGLRAIAVASALPVIAIGGITVERVPAILAAGAYGIAVLGAVASADDPAAEVARFRAALDAAVTG